MNEWVKAIYPNLNEFQDIKLRREDNGIYTELFHLYNVQKHMTHAQMLLTIKYGQDGKVQKCCACLLSSPH